ncbi:MAG: HPF/RaiA family ribosome-associated protein [Elusimicrobiota bacterium]
MQVKIHSKGCNIAKKDLDYIKKKITRLEIFSAKIEVIDLTVSMQKYFYFLELRVKTSFKTFVIKKDGQEVRVVVDILIDKMEYQLRKFKDKLKLYHPHTRTKYDYISSGIIPDYDIVAKKQNKLPSMTKEQAVSALRKSEESYLIFVDDETKKMSILRRVSPDKYEIVRAE